mgnify:CR=1 FL=1
MLATEEDDSPDAKGNKSEKVVRSVLSSLPESSDYLKVIQVWPYDIRRPYLGWSSEKTSWPGEGEHTRRATLDGSGRLSMVSGPPREIWPKWSYEFVYRCSDEKLFDGP